MLTRISDKKKWLKIRNKPYIKIKFKSTFSIPVEYAYFPKTQCPSKRIIQTIESKKISDKKVKKTVGMPPGACFNYTLAPLSSPRQNLPDCSYLPLVSRTGTTSFLVCSGIPTRLISGIKSICSPLVKEIWEINQKKNDWYRQLLY